MASKVLVKLPTVTFLQGKKPPSDIVTLTERNENLNQTKRHQNINIDRVAQLEQNMKFLQEQHQATLVALHQEVDSLRQKNRDLQFQLVFSKGSTCAISSPSSPEDNETGFVMSKGSPVSVNISSLQVELLEKDLQDTKISLQKAKNQNQYLTEIIEQQKKKLQSIEEQTANKQSMIDVGTQVHDYNTLILLLKQNIDQEKEIETLKAALAYTSGNKGARFRDGINSHRRRGSPTSTSQEQMPHECLPGHSQCHRHHKALMIERSGRNRYDKHDHQPGLNSTVLLQLQKGCYRPQGCRNYYRDESNRKYRGQSSQKDRTDSDNCHHRREFKDRCSKVHKKELVDSTEGSTEADNSTGSKS